MAINRYNIEKWYKMLSGKSVLHVNQDIGKSFSCEQIKGYYNNLTEKVIMEPEFVDNKQLPSTKQPNNNIIIFPVAIFQYALGCYDLYLQTGDKRYINKFCQLANWTLTHQDKKGRWANFAHAYPSHPYGAMAQGEAVSVLIRAYIESKDSVFLNAAKLGIDYMLLPIEQGGTTKYVGDDVIFMEYTHLPTVMNGWIFAWWGLYDYVKTTKDNGRYLSLMNQSCQTLINFLPSFSTSIWSKYDLDHRIASPFYHNLHIAQMQAMYKLTGEIQFCNYAIRWEKQQHNLYNKSLAFGIKVFQKITEK